MESLAKRVNAPRGSIQLLCHMGKVKPWPILWIDLKNGSMMPGLTLHAIFPALVPAKSFGVGRYR